MKVGLEHLMNLESGLERRSPVEIWTMSYQRLDVSGRAGFVVVNKVRKKDPGEVPPYYRLRSRLTCVVIGLRPQLSFMVQTVLSKGDVVGV
jgi:hypothetical protein